MTDTPTARYSGKQSSSEAFAGHSTIYGRGGDLDRPYLTRLWFGRLRLHIFFKGDQDPDPHDHPWDFWTLPLVAYEEEVLGPDHMTLTRQIVPAWRISFRTANHTHRVLGPRPGPIARWLRLPLITIVWRGRTWRKWGFWPGKSVWRDRHYISDLRKWMPWDQYLANKDGGAGISAPFCGDCKYCMGLLCGRTITGSYGRSLRLERKRLFFSDTCGPKGRFFEPKDKPS